MVIGPEFDHLAIIRLKPHARLADLLNELTSITEWLDELVRWQEDQYKLKHLPASYKLHVWFKEEKHATICRIRWG